MDIFLCRRISGSLGMFVHDKDWRNLKEGPLALVWNELNTGFAEEDELVSFYLPEQLCVVKEKEYEHD